MAISETSSRSSVALAEEIQEMIHELSNELAKDERQVQKDARQAELSEGLRAAEDMHDKASAIRTGAWISGAMTVAGGVCTGVSLSTTDKAARFWASGGDYATKLGDKLSGFSNAAAADDEASSMSAQARSRAAGHQADEASKNERAAQKVDDSAKELLQEINRNHHAGMMAIVSRS